MTVFFYIQYVTRLLYYRNKCAIESSSIDGFAGAAEVAGTIPLSSVVALFFESVKIAFFLIFS